MVVERVEIKLCLLDNSLLNCSLNKIPKLQLDSFDIRSNEVKFMVTLAKNIGSTVAAPFRFHFPQVLLTYSIV